MAADHIGHAVNQLRDVAGHPAIDDAAHDGARTAGGFLRRFGDDRTARCQRRRHFLAHQIDREIPRREGRDRANRLLQHQRALAGRADKDAAIAALCLFGEIVELRGARQHFGARFGQGFALFGGQQHGNAFGALTDETRNLVQYGCAFIDIGFAPECKTRSGCRQRFIEISYGGQRQLRQRFAGRGVDDGVGVAPFALAPGAVDEKRQIGVVTGGHVRSPAYCYITKLM